jgi:hypothetical protein
MTNIILDPDRIGISDEQFVKLSNRIDRMTESAVVQHIQNYLIDFETRLTDIEETLGILHDDLRGFGKVDE